VDSDLLEHLPPITVGTGNEREVIVLNPSRVALGLELADPAMTDRLGIRVPRRSVRDSFQRPTDVAVQRRDFGKLDGLQGPVSEQHGGGLRQRSLDLADEGAVDEELVHEARLNAAGQLRVDHLVGPIAEIGRVIDPTKEVRPALPTPAEERRLINEPSAGPHRVCRPCTGRFEAPGTEVEVATKVDVITGNLRYEERELLRLERLASLAGQGCMWIAGRPRAPAEITRDGEPLLDEVLAG